MRVADKFTAARLFFAPVFLCCYLFAAHNGKYSLPVLAILIVLLAGAEFTDFLDGYFARKLKQVSDFGKIFDPFADVVLHLTTFFCFTLAGFFPGILFMLIVYREFAMLFLRLLSIKQGVAIGARKGGKLKTICYVFTGFYMLAFELYSRTGISTFVAPDWVGFALAGLCTILAYISCIDYLIHFGSVFKTV
ncbi:CDP-diacylglycerol--glycerol-3-phosphate 3-phosphatidyltransferase [Spirochaetia bacterium]|nr:CDP-diacylglycerol--glycerol-3-phosphate 3-phosphatidyltransferase [Spirochaetia bacterium]GHU30381.1 CDP-diacylglycerol--glycerol-3-phosphate 3-phosphatidyltransferase [Spirochaetia bacterium]